MRRSWWTAGAFALALAGCKGEDVAPPDLRRPIEALPSGARAVVLTSDLRNTWQRVEAHDLRTVLENWPGTAKVLRDSDVVRFQAACRDFEVKNGTRLQDDLFLNALGGRAGLAVYGRGPGTGSAGSDGDRDGDGNGDGNGARRSADEDLLFVAELQDAARFRTAFTALAAAAGPHAPEIHEQTFDGQPAWRVEGIEGRAFTVVLREQFLVAGTGDELIRRALALHGGSGGGSALADSTLRAALRAVGPHNVTGLVDRGGGAWAANGFTWDPAGLHFDQMVSMAAGSGHASEPTPEVWKSIPSGMTLAGCVRHRDLDLGELGRSLRMGAAGAPGATRVAHNSPLPMLPDLSRPWVGDAIGVALRGVEATTVAPVPDVAFILAVRDTAAAAADLRSLENSLRGVPVGALGRGFEDVHYGGRTYRTLVQPFSETVSPCWSVDGGVAIVTTTRTLMQQILDTRRSGRRAIRSDASFTRFKTFVPEDAAAVFYADQRRLHHVAEQLQKSSSLWGPQVEESIAWVGRLSGVLEHFPAGAAYVTRGGESVTLRGWMAEAQ